MLFCQARKKLSHSAFIELIHKGIEFFTAHLSPKTWHGFRLLATDGSTAKVPKTEKVSDYFGAWNPAKGERCPAARVSQMFDVLNHIIIVALIAPKSHGERDLAAQHFAYIGPQDLILLDRGYPALWLFQRRLSQYNNKIGSFKEEKLTVVFDKGMNSEENMAFLIKRMNLSASNVINEMNELNSSLVGMKGQRSPKRLIDGPNQIQAKILNSFGYKVVSGVLENMN